MRHCAVITLMKCSTAVLVFVLAAGWNQRVVAGGPPGQVLCWGANLLHGVVGAPPGETYSTNVLSVAGSMHLNL